MGSCLNCSHVWIWQQWQLLLCSYCGSHNGSCDTGSVCVRSLHRGLQGNSNQTGMMRFSWWGWNSRFKSCGLRVFHKFVWNVPDSHKSPSEKHFWINGCGEQDLTWRNDSNSTVHSKTSGISRSHRLVKFRGVYIQAKGLFQSTGLQCNCRHR